MLSNEFARGLVVTAHGMLHEHLRKLTLDEALFSAGGYRSILGVLKHIGGWAHVYRSYAFDENPKHWNGTSWPRGLRDTVGTTKDYVDEVIAWIDEALADWDRDLQGCDDLSQQRPVHWGATASLANIVVMHANHVVYHTGELNMLLSISRGEAWEYSEEVEENHISTLGHGVPAVWMTDEQRRAHEDAMRRRHDELWGVRT